MKRFLQIFTILILTSSCGQEQRIRQQGSTDTYIDGENIELTDISNTDSLNFKPDSSRIHNSRLKSEGIIQAPLTNPIKILDSIFSDYIQYQESTDSREDKRMLTQALNQLDSSLTETDLILIINIWLYYDPTDFPTRTLTEQVFRKNLKKSISAVKNRKVDKMDWEREDSAPYSELDYLLKKLEKEKK